MSTGMIPQTSQELGEYAREILRSLVRQYRIGNQFTDDSLDTGLIYRCSGSVSLLLLVNAFEQLQEEPDWRKIVDSEFDAVLKHVSENGFDATPFVPAKTTSLFFSISASARNNYVDSLTWALSFGVLLRLSQRTKLFKHDAIRVKKVMEFVRNTVQAVCDVACEQGGWGFTQGCSQPDLYFSYAASEALADFGDYVLGESPEIIDADEDLKAVLGPELIERIAQVRKRTAEWLIREYLGSLGERLIAPPGTNSSDPICLYYTYFVLDMLIVNQGDELFPEKRNEIHQGIEHAIYHTRIMFDKAHEDQDWWKDPKKSSLLLNWEKHPVLDNKLKGMRNLPDLFEPGLVPLSLRCNCLYSYYLSGGTDKKIKDLFRMVYEDTNSATKLWDSENYTLMVTERSIEAIVDYADYLIKYEVPVRSDATPESSGGHALSSAIALSVSEFLTSPQGRELLSSNDGSRLPVEQIVSKEAELARLLISLFSKGEAVLDGADDQYLSQGTFQMLGEKFHSFLLHLLVERSGTFVDRDGNERISRNDLKNTLEKNEKELLHAIGKWNVTQSNGDLGAVFNSVVDKFLVARGEKTQKRSL